MDTNRTRTSTKYTMAVGSVLILAAVVVVIVSLIIGTINSNNIVDSLWCLLLSAASFFGINLVRVGAENIATINAATTAATNPPTQDTTVTNHDGTATVSTGGLPDASN